MPRRKRTEAKGQGELPFAKRKKQSGRKPKAKPKPPTKKMVRKKLPVTFKTDVKENMVRAFDKQGNLIGMGRFTRDAYNKKAFTLYVDHVVDKFRRQGVGTELMRELERRAKNAGARQISFLSRQDNKGIAKIAKMLGYRASKPFRDISEPVSREPWMVTYTKIIEKKH